MSWESDKRVAHESNTRVAQDWPQKPTLLHYEASGFGPPDGDRYTGPRLGPQVAQCVRVGLAQGGEL